MLLCLLAVACGGDEQERKRAASSSATALLVARRWVAGEVPTGYAEDALERAADELRKGPLPRAAVPVEELREAVARGDRERAAKLVDELSRP